MSVLPFDQRDGFIWMNGALVLLEGCKAACPVTWPALRLLLL